MGAVPLGEPLDENGLRLKLVAKIIKVLLIEDHPSARELFRVLLEAENYQVIEAADGRQGVELAGAEKPDLVILDLMIPGVDGERVVSQLKRNEALKDTQILVVSGKTEALDGMRTLLGPENVFSKPFEPTILLDRIGELVGHPDDLGS